jgi:hypothetical protein
MCWTARFFASASAFAVLAASPIGWAEEHEDDDEHPRVVELDETRVFIEWNSTDTDFGIQFFWDSDGFTHMKVRNDAGQAVLDVGTRGNVKAQGLTEGFFESVEPPASELSMEEFLTRFPEGEYDFEGRGIDGERLEGEADFTHVLPAPPEDLSPSGGEVLSAAGFTASFRSVTTDFEGDPLEVELYEVVVEKLDDEPILQVFQVILPPTDDTFVTVSVPGEFLEPDTEYKLEVIVQEESGNRTIAESDDFATGP